MAARGARRAARGSAITHADRRVGAFGLYVRHCSQRRGDSTRSPPPPPPPPAAWVGAEEKEAREEPRGVSPPEKAAVTGMLTMGELLRGRTAKWSTAKHAKPASFRAARNRHTSGLRRAIFLVVGANQHPAATTTLLSNADVSYRATGGEDAYSVCVPGLVPNPMHARPQCVSVVVTPEVDSGFAFSLGPNASPERLIDVSYRPPRGSRGAQIVVNSRSATNRWGAAPRRVGIARDSAIVVGTRPVCFVLQLTNTAQHLFMDGAHVVSLPRTRGLCVHDTVGGRALYLRLPVRSSCNNFQYNANVHEVAILPPTRNMDAALSAAANDRASTSAQRGYKLRFRYRHPLTSAGAALTPEILNTFSVRQETIARSILDRLRASAVRVAVQATARAGTGEAPRIAMDVTFQTLTAAQTMVDLWQSPSRLQHMLEKHMSGWVLVPPTEKK